MQLSKIHNHKTNALSSDISYKSKVLIRKDGTNLIGIVIYVGPADETLRVYAVFSDKSSTNMCKSFQELMELLPDCSFYEID